MALLAHWQKAFSLLVLVGPWVLGLLGWQWPAPALVWLALALGLGQPAVLGLEFLIMGRVNRSAGLPVPSAKRRWRAWALECLWAWWVFGWCQPWRSQQEPDLLVPGGGRRGVLLLHGYFCNRGFWQPWLRRLRAQGRPFMALSLAPVFGSIDEYGPHIEEAVQRLTRLTGRAPVVLAHSMGGLAVRAWWRQRGDDSALCHVVTLGSPHRGTWLARFARSRNGRQMRLDGAWLQALARSEPAARRARFSCVHSDCDNIVFPASTALLAGATDWRVEGVAHVALAFDAGVQRRVLALLEALDAEG